MIRMRMRAMGKWVWGCEAEEGEDGSLGMVEGGGGEEVAMCQIAGTEGTRATRVRDMARRPSFDTPVTWLCSDAPTSSTLASSTTSNVERKGVVGLLLGSSSERG